MIILNSERTITMKNHSTHRLTLASLSILGGILIAQSAMATAPHPGKILHEENCLRCHVDKPYNPVKTDSFSKLLKTIRFCDNNLGTGLFDEEINELADYLNKTYYQHPK